MHNISFFWRTIVEKGIFAEPFSADVPISGVDFNDVAEVAPLALTKPELGRGSFELCTEGMLNRHQRAVFLSEVLGRPVRAVASSLDEWREKNPRLTNATVLRTILGREPATLMTFVERYAAAEKH